MPDPVVTFNGVDEISLDEMIAKLTHDVKTLAFDSIRARSAGALIDVMPGFVKMLSRERALFEHQVRERHRIGYGGQQPHILDAHLMVMALPIINMLVSTIVALVPRQDDPRCVEIRTILLENMLENIRSEVADHTLKVVDANKFQ